MKNLEEKKCYFTRGRHGREHSFEITQFGKQACCMLYVKYREKLLSPDPRDIPVRGEDEQDYSFGVYVNLKIKTEC